MPAGICPDIWKGDGECDRVCNSREHQFDRGDCECVDSHPMCASMVAQGQWSCETMMCDDRDSQGRPVCPKPRLCQLSCAAARGDEHCTDEITRQELAGGGGFDTHGDKCPAVVINPTPMASHCTLRGGICMENKADCEGLLKGTCGSSCGCCYADLRRACRQFAGDGQCDPRCNTAEFGFDGYNRSLMRSHGRGKGDCSLDAQFQACPLTWIADGECDEECNNEENDYDYPDCTPTSATGIPFCPPSWLVSKTKHQHSQTLLN